VGQRADLLLASFALFGYYILFEGLNRGRTPGKILLGIRVVMDSGRPITLAAAALRNLVRAPSTPRCSCRGAHGAAAPQQ